VLGSLDEGFAKRKVLLGYREIEQRQEPRTSAYRRRGDGYGAWHALDKVTITLAIEVAKEAVAQIVLPTDSIDCVYWRRITGGITMAESAVIAVNRKTQSLRRDLIIGQPEGLGQLGDYRKKVFSHQVEKTCFGGSAAALWVHG
jgi:hypothetical protein